MCERNPENNNSETIISKRYASVITYNTMAMFVYEDAVQGSNPLAEY
jgi:hypothetical protein